MRNKIFIAGVSQGSTMATAVALRYPKKWTLAGCAA
jgi:predicted esterase